MKYLEEQLTLIIDKKFLSSVILKDVNPLKTTKFNFEDENNNLSKLHYLLYIDFFLILQKLALILIR